ncbi:MAG: hypothetical protein LUE92_12130 [Clostridiales bacterium]|nr:hypothetical protein [Clostridiales bacterium]
MGILNYLLCILALAVLVWETYLVLRRNRTIIVPEKDDFFVLCLVLFLALLVLSPDTNAGMLESLCNMLILAALFFSIAVRRGISQRGIEKLGFVIPWDKIQKIYIEPYQLSKLTVFFYTEGRRYKLLFPKSSLRKLVYEMQKYFPEILLEESLTLD